MPHLIYDNPVAYAWIFKIKLHINKFVKIAQLEWEGKLMILNTISTAYLVVKDKNGRQNHCSTLYDNLCHVLKFNIFCNIGM